MALRSLLALVKNPSAWPSAPAGPPSILTLRSCTQSSLSRILVIWDVFERRFHRRSPTNAHVRALCDLACNYKGSLAQA